MNLQDVSKFSIAILNQVLAFQKDGFTDFSLKNGNEVNPDTGKYEECVVLDMIMEKQTKTVNYFYA